MNASVKMSITHTHTHFCSFFVFFSPSTRGHCGSSVRTVSSWQRSRSRSTDLIAVTDCTLNTMLCDPHPLGAHAVCGVHRHSSHNVVTQRWETVCWKQSKRQGRELGNGAALVREKGLMMIALRGKQARRCPRLSSSCLIPIHQD